MTSIARFATDEAVFEMRKGACEGMARPLAHVVQDRNDSCKLRKLGLYLFIGQHLKGGIVSLQAFVHSIVGFFGEVGKRHEEVEGTSSHGIQLLFNRVSRGISESCDRVVVKNTILESGILEGFNIIESESRAKRKFVGITFKVLQEVIL